MPLYGISQLVDSFRTVRTNTIRVAEDIPESEYRYRPAPTSRSVAETLAHIAWLARADRVMHEEKRLASFDGFDFAAFLAMSEVEETRERAKVEIIELLRTEGDRWARWVEQLPETFLSESFRLPDGKSVNRFEMLLGTKEHEMQHRAQLTVIQRLLGLVPHFTRNLPISRERAA
ncbi:MAG: hypothetical protein NVS4B3_25200 [Gemmatimonadaceae bacterium]